MVTKDTFGYHGSQSYPIVPIIKLDLKLFVKNKFAKFGFSKFIGSRARERTDGLTDTSNHIKHQ